MEVLQGLYIAMLLNVSPAAGKALSLHWTHALSQGVAKLALQWAPLNNMQKWNGT